MLLTLVLIRAVWEAEEAEGDGHAMNLRRIIHLICEVSDKIQTVLERIPLYI